MGRSCPFIFPLKVCFVVRISRILFSYTTMAMEQNVIEFDRDERKESYLEEVFSKSNIEFEAVKGSRCEYRFLCDKRDRDEIMCAFICNFYKLNEIMRVFASAERNDAFYALIGSLIGLDFDEDAKKVRTEIKKQEFINVDGFYNFCLTDMKEAWRGLAKLSHKLYEQCKNSEEVYALCIFMLGMGEEMGETIVISPKKELYKQIVGTKIAVVPYFGQSDVDIIVTLLSNHPSNVIISDPTSVSEKILTVIRALGESNA